MNTTSPLTNNSKEFNILSVNFNQDQGCFAAGHETGFLVFNTNPIDLRVKRIFTPTSSSGSGIGHITMLHRTNYLALVGGGKNPKFPNNKMVIWDDLKRKNSLTLEFMSPVMNVLLSRIRIVVVLKNQVLVYGFSSPPKACSSYETIDNPLGLADLSVNSGSGSSLSSSFSSLTSSSSRDGSRYQILAFVGRSAGLIQIVDVSPAGQEKNLISIVKAHKSKIRCLALNRSGTMVASASETGTIIRIHSTHNTALLFEFRRGLDRAVVTSMKFSPDDTRLAVLSDKTTLHIFNLSSNAGETTNMNESLSEHSVASEAKPSNRKHIFTKLPVPIPFNNYFNSVWSFCSTNTSQYHGEFEHGFSNDEGAIGWSGNDSVVIVWKQKKIWEKYVIMEKERSDNRAAEWHLIRTSWKSLDLDENT